MIFQTVKCNRLWELQCKQCTYAPTAEGAHLLLLFPSGVTPSRAGRLSWALQSHSYTVPACLPSSSSAPSAICGCWQLAQKSRMARWSLPCWPFPVPVCTWRCSGRHGTFLGNLTLPWQRKTCQPGELNSRSDELSHGAGVARVHHLP